MADVSNLNEALQFQRDTFNRAFAKGRFTGVVQNLAYGKRVGFSLKFFKKNGRILDIGCGDGTVTKAVTDALASETIAIDVSEQAVRVAQETNPSSNITYLVSNIESYGSEKKFDGILMFELIEHIFRPAEVLAKLRALLNEGGVLLISTPNDKRMTRRIKSAFGVRHIRKLLGKKKKRIGCDHFQEFDYQELRSLLESAGFQVIGYEGIIFWTDTVGGKMFKEFAFLQKLNFSLGSLFPAVAGHIYVAARKTSQP